MVDSRAHEIPGGTEDLDSTAQRLFGKFYTRLTDDEANAVWDDIEAREDSLRPASETPGTVAAAQFMH